ncbi:hypothetical protein HDU91_003524, partial [Kappamyces sp. JEL0680]
TIVNAHNFVTVSMSYMNDGIQTARNTPNVATLLSTTGAADITWLYQAFINAFGSGNQTSSHQLVGFYPGTVNPMLWWATPNLMVLAPSALSGGIETALAMVAKIGIGRTYSTQGQNCINSVQNQASSTVGLNDQGFLLGVSFLIVEFFILLFSLLCMLPWMWSTIPIYPAIRLIEDRTYFSIMVSKNSTAAAIVKDAGGLSENSDIWPRLDTSFKVGESRSTADDDEKGLIVLDKPRMVAPLKWGKQYS